MEIMYEGETACEGVITKMFENKSREHIYEMCTCINVNYPAIGFVNSHLDPYHFDKHELFPRR